MKPWLLDLILTLVRLILPAILSAKPQRYETVEAHDQQELRARLQRRIRSWALIVLLLPACIGCRTHTIYIRDRTPVQLRQTVPNVKVWIFRRGAEPIPGVIDLDEGWYVLSDPGPGEGGE